MLENINSNVDMLYSKKPAYIYGFHGCSKSVYESVLLNDELLQESKNQYDWLGNGIYFWENSYQRAVDWAKAKYGKDWAVIGAFIDLGYCLDTTDYRNAPIFKLGYELLKFRIEDAGEIMPRNIKGRNSNDVLVRNLDCAVIQEIHEYNKSQGLKQYDSVRGIFEEGEEMYPGAGFKEKTHTQVCIINPNCIKGYFTPKTMDKRYDMP